VGSESSVMFVAFLMQYKLLSALCGYSDQSFWLQIQRSGFDSQRYQIF
jgi:hypothetical protein